MQVDVVDVGRRRGRRARAHRAAPAARRGLRDAATTCDERRSIRRSRAARCLAPPSRSSSAKPAASPRLMPRRATSNGRHGSGETSSSELKPNSTLPHSVSTPPTTAASASPARISRSACANTLALEEHAVATVTQTPVRPSACWTKSPSECGVCMIGGAGPADSGPPASRRGRPPRSRRCSTSKCRHDATRSARSARAPRAPRRGSRRRRGRAMQADCCGIPIRRAAGQRLRFEPGDAADPGRERRRAEVVRRSARCADRAGATAALLGRRRRRWSRCRRRCAAGRWGAGTGREAQESGLRIIAACLRARAAAPAEAARPIDQRPTTTRPRTTITAATASSAVARPRRAAGRRRRAGRAPGR